MAFTRAANTEDLWENEKIGVRVEGRRVLLVHADGAIHAYEDRCPHRGVPLSGGDLSGFVLTCYAHCWQYDVRSGDGINPRDARLRRIPVKVVSDAILVDVEHTDDRP